LIEVVLSIRNRQTTGWVASAAFHLLLFLAFLVISVSMDSRVETFAEMLFLSSPPSQSTGRQDVGAGIPLATSPVEPDPATIVNLPERRPALLPPDEILPVSSRQETELQRLQPSTVMDRVARTGLERPPTRIGSPTGEKIAPPLTGNPAGNLPPIEGAAAATGGADRPYQIQWVGEHREIVRSILPDVPAGIEREVTLQFRFRVTPAGDVTAIRPLQKGEPVLEGAAQTALRQWRFQPLPPESPQEPQEAVITFRFRIRTG
jgi:TonB family protein